MSDEAIGTSDSRGPWERLVDEMTKMEGAIDRAAGELSFDPFGFLYRGSKIGNALLALPAVREAIDAGLPLARAAYAETKRQIIEQRASALREDASGLERQAADLDALLVPPC